MPHKNFKYCPHSRSNNVHAFSLIEFYCFISSLMNSLKIAWSTGTARLQVLGALVLLKVRQQYKYPLQDWWLLTVIFTPPKFRNLLYCVDKWICCNLMHLIQKAQRYGPCLVVHWIFHQKLFFRNGKAILPLLLGLFTPPPLLLFTVTVVGTG